VTIEVTDFSLSIKPMVLKNSKISLNRLTTYLEVTAVDPTGKSISQLGHVFTVQRRLLVIKVRYELFANLQTPLGVCRQDAWEKVV